MRRGWIFVLLAAAAGAGEFSEADLDQAIREVGWGYQLAVRRIAAWGPRASRAVPTLVGAWSVPTKELRVLIDEALRAMGPLAVPEVVKALKSRDVLVRERAGEFLEALVRSPSGVPLDPALEDSLLDLLDHEDPRVRLAVGRTLASRGAAVVPKLAPLLGGKSPRRRHGAAFALSCIDPPPEEALAALVAATADKDESVREQALIAVARLRLSEAEVVRALVAALADRSEGVVSVAVADLSRRGPAVVAQLVAAWDIDAAAAYASEVLVRLGDAAIEPASEALRSGGAERKRHAAACLGRIGAARDVPVEGVLAVALKDPDAEVRLAAANALGIATAAVANRALDALLAATKDADLRVGAASLSAASRAAPQDPRVGPLLRAAKLAADPPSKLAAAAADAKSPDECGAVAKSPVAPVAARLLAAEKLRVMGVRPGGAVEALGRLVADRNVPLEVRAAGADAIAAIAGRRLFELRYEPREDAQTKGFRAAAGKALEWLALTQQTKERGGDGRWKSDGSYQVTYDVGLTALAVLTFLAAGQTDRVPATYAKNVREGIEWLLSKQTPEGLIREGANQDHTILEHAIATHALCELVGMTQDDTLRPQAQKAIDYCVATRGAKGWQYVARGPTSNTNVTAWVGVALSMADQLGFQVDPEALEGVRQWIDTMTEPNFGQVGYDYPGGRSSRPTGRHDRFPADKTFAMTACGILCRVLLGEDPVTSEMVKKGADLCVELPPKWNPEDGSIDMYYWYYGSLATFHTGDLWWGKWAKALGAALLPKQEGGGRWKPVDVWADYGGSPYATTMCALALLTPWRYPRSFVRLGKPPTAYATAVAALKEAAKSPCERLRAAATRALSRCPGG